METPPYTVEQTDPGCPHCGAGKRFIVKGPGIPIDSENDWAESTAISHVAALNGAFEAGRAPTSTAEPK